MNLEVEVEAEITKMSLEVEMKILKMNMMTLDPVLR